MLRSRVDYSELPSYDSVIPALLDVGIQELKKKCKLTPGVPLKPMLAKPTKAIGEVLDRFENKRFTCEYKYDGERAQVRDLLLTSIPLKLIFGFRFIVLRMAKWAFSVVTRKT